MARTPDIQVQWTAKEHEEKIHGPDWFWTVGVLALALAVGAMLFDNTLLAVLIVVGTIALLLQTLKKSPLITFIVSDIGIQIGDVLYHYQDLDSFSLTDNNILIKSKKRLMPYIMIPFTQEHEEDIYEILSTYLPEEEHLEPISDRIMETLGF